VTTRIIQPLAVPPLVFGLVSRLVIGLGYWLSLTAWGQWVILARLWLPLTGRSPWAVAPFLDDACRTTWCDPPDAFDVTSSFGIVPAA
jgi:hypothetical protein